MAAPFAPAPREPVPEPRPTPRTSPGDLPLRAAAPAAVPEPPIDEAAAEARIEELTARLRGDPKNAAVASELASLLEAVGRDLDLLSLLSARVDEASEDERPALAKERARVTARLAEKARVEGRISEAELYESMLAIDT